MQALRAHVRNGQIILDEPTDLPEGASVEVHVLEAGDTRLSTEERAELERAIEEGADDFERGEFEDAREFAVRLAARR